jgi:hypothetical protein
MGFVSGREFTRAEYGAKWKGPSGPERFLFAACKNRRLPHIARKLPTSRLSITYPVLAVQQGVLIPRLQPDTPGR